MYDKDQLIEQSRKAILKFLIRQLLKKLKDENITGPTRDELQVCIVVLRTIQQERSLFKGMALDGRTSISIQYASSIDTKAPEDNLMVTHSQIGCINLYLKELMNDDYIERFHALTQTMIGLYADLP